VRLHYQDSKTVEVHESGPWNVDDNYWSKLSDPQPRRLFPDLPLGMPEAQAAYFDDYNNGEDQFGRNVTAPFGIDLSDAVSIDIGLQPGHNDWIDVTWLWTEDWDSRQSEVVTLFKPTSLHPSFGATCTTFWYRIDGYDADAYLTLNVDNAGDSTNWAEWEPNLPSDGEYAVWAYVPDHPSINWPCPAKLVQSDTSDARYVIHHANGVRTVSGNQRPLTYMWIDLGTYTFESGAGGRVTLSDLNGETSLSRTVSFSAIMFRRALPPPPTPTPTATPTLTPTPTPTLTPTPTPTPEPYAFAGFGLVQAGEAVTIPLGLNHIQPPGVGSVALDVRFDPAVAAWLGCVPDPGGVFDAAACNPDPAITGTLHLNLTSTLGTTGNPLLAWLAFQAFPTPGAYTGVDLVSPAFRNPSGTPLPIPVHHGSLCVQPCQNTVYLPVVGK
jgi:hypothetical protein